MTASLLRGHEQRYQVRLDSVGTWDGYPAAFLSTVVDQVRGFGEGRQRVSGRGRYVRRLDVRVNVFAEIDHRIESEAPGVFSDGSPYQAVLRGARQIRAVQSVRWPPERGLPAD